MHYNLINILDSHGFGNKITPNSIYINLYKSIKSAIINRSIKENYKLPPTRILARDLEISRSTVIKAYELLSLENFVKSVPGSGYFVTSLKHKKMYYNLQTNSKAYEYPTISEKGIVFQKNIHIINNAVSNDNIAFKPGLPPLDIFPINKWKKLKNLYWNSVRPSQLSYSEAIGNEGLRRNISDYLKIYRNIDCEPNQIIITSGSLHSLYLISNALVNKNDKVMMENLSYPHAFRLFKSLNAKIALVDLNKEKIDLGRVNSKGAKFFYAIPSNQSYSGTKMAMDKRLKLTQWASKNGSLIIEDDYEHEFSNWKNPLASIYSLDKQDRVIYLGTFNKLLHPSIRLGYMIVPKYLISPILGIYEQSSRFMPSETQKIMSLFIEKDYLNQHIRNVVKIAHERKKIFIEQFDLAFKNEIMLDPSNIGLNIIGRFKNKKINDKELSKHLLNYGIVTNPLSKYYLKKPKEKGLVMGYSCVNSKTIKETIVKMKEIFDNYMSLQ